MKSPLVVVTSILIAAVIVILLFARVFFIDYSILPQNGMYPETPAGSLVFSWKRPYKQVSDVRRGDVVLFVRNQNGTSYNYIWRVVGLPGDRVEIDGEAISINGSPLRRDKVTQNNDFIVYTEVNGEAAYQVAYPVNPNGRKLPRTFLTIPSNEVFVLGDNRFNAEDSSYFGPIRFDAIYGRKL